LTGIKLPVKSDARMARHPFPTRIARPLKVLARDPKGLADSVFLTELVFPFDGTVPGTA